MPKKRKNRISRVEKKIDEVLALEKRLFKETVKEEKELGRIEREEKTTEELEKKELKELENLENIEKQIRQEVGTHPLTKITIKDAAKGMIGAFVGITSHFAFLEGARIAGDMTNLRASFLLISAFLIGFVFIYLTGYRKIKESTLLKLFPIRVFVIYTISLVSIFIVLTLYGIIALDKIDVGLVYRQLGSISIPAIIGASAADLIGRE